jgi:DnaJ-class molecular chaperone
MKTNFLFIKRNLFCGKINVISKERAYQILEITPNSSQTEIRTAYIKLAKTFHPDVNIDSKEKFKEIHQAYELLKDSKIEIKNYKENIDSIIDNFLKTQQENNDNEQSLSKKLNKISYEIQQKEAENDAKNLQMNEEYYRKIRRKLEKFKRKRLEKFQKTETNNESKCNKFSEVKPNLNQQNLKNSNIYEEYNKNEIIKDSMNKFSSIFTYLISMSTISVFLVMVGGKYGGLLSLYIIIMTLKK